MGNRRRIVGASGIEYWHEDPEPGCIGGRMIIDDDPTSVGKFSERIQEAHVMGIKLDADKKRKDSGPWNDDADRSVHR